MRPVGWLPGLAARERTVPPQAESPRREPLTASISDCSNQLQVVVQVVDCAIQLQEYHVCW